MRVAWTCGEAIDGGLRLEIYCSFKMDRKFLMRQSDMSLILHGVCLSSVDKGIFLTVFFRNLHLFSFCTRCVRSEGAWNGMDGRLKCHQSVKAAPRQQLAEAL